MGFVFGLGAILATIITMAWIYGKIDDVFGTGWSLVSLVVMAGILISGMHVLGAFDHNPRFEQEVELKVNITQQDTSCSNDESDEE